MKRFEQGGHGIAVVLGLSWDGGRVRAAAAAVAMMVAVMLVAPTQAMASTASAEASVIVTTDGDIAGATEATEALGGTVTQQLAIIDGFVATISIDRVGALASTPSIVNVVEDAKVQLTGRPVTSSKTSAGSLAASTETIRAQHFWNDGFNGTGIDVALIDSGVAPVTGLTAKGKVINGPDLSFESQDDDTRYVDTFGHGTHMAGIIAGYDDGFSGVAPGSRIVNVKVAGADGSVDVSQVIAAIDWVVQHRADNGMNIRVLNLSFGTDGVQSYQLDPLSFAAEAAWRSGIVVVVAAGNDGNKAAVRNPALNPFVIVAGAADTKGTASTKDDELPRWATCGTRSRSVDVVAPGRSIESLRAPGSTIDRLNPGAVVDERFFKGSGTSQAAAFVSGSAALILSQRPDATPDQVKALLMSAADDMANLSGLCEGAGLINLKTAVASRAPLTSLQSFLPSTGLGTLEGARGSIHVQMDGVVLEGEIDIFGQAWSSAEWAKLSAHQVSWDGGIWNGSSWSGSSWSGSSWSGSSWSGSSWSGSSWSGSSWSGAAWSSAIWN
ncbi:MAG: S8 family serine peptidase [Acidimicrobiia bacterium]|nr:S8 family serine peptidase [Acidimicrobiia bacterium]